ncbi:MAG: hypothetical protein EOP45_09580, partial [Sphingobacteriaceae bacterium]
EPGGEDMKTLRYADDVALVVSDVNMYRAANNINQYLQEVIQYAKRFKLKLNKAKCELLTILGQWKDIGATVRKNLKQIEIKIDEHILERKDEIKYLGIMFNKQFYL